MTYLDVKNRPKARLSLHIGSVDGWTSQPFQNLVTSLPHSLSSPSPPQKLLSIYNPRPVEEVSGGIPLWNEKWALLRAYSAASSPAHFPPLPDINNLSALHSHGQTASHLTDGECSLSAQEAMQRHI